VSNDSANAPSVRAEVSPTSAKLGDLITLDIRVTHPLPLIVEDPAFAKNLGTFEVYASTRLPSETEGDQRIDRFQAQLQNFTTGQQLLPGLEVPYRDPMGAVAKVKTPELKVTIEEVPPGPKDNGTIRGIKGVIGPVAWSPWWWLLLAVAAVAAGLVLWKKRKRLIEGPPPPPPIPPDVDALAKLQGLRESGLLASGKLKEFYSAMSDILRAYLEAAFRIQALERTTNELMRDLRKKPVGGLDRMAELKDLLELADLVKFAKFKPEVDEAVGDHEKAVKYVEETRQLLPGNDGEGK
jgi:hypothetical protein